MISSVFKLLVCTHNSNMNSDKNCKTCVNYLLFRPNRCPQRPMLFPLLARVPPPKFSPAPVFCHSPWSIFPRQVFIPMQFIKHDWCVLEHVAFKLEHKCVPIQFTIPADLSKTILLQTLCPLQSKFHLPMVEISLHVDSPWQFSWHSSSSLHSACV